MNLKRTVKFLVVSFLLILILPLRINAQEEKDQNIFKGNFYKISEETVTIDQEIDGDVMVIAKELKINSPVKGDVLAIGRNIEINGEVEGDVRIAGEKTVILSKVGKGVNILAGEAEFGENSQIGKNVLIYADNFKNKGIIKGNIDGKMGIAELGNLIEGNINIKLNENGNLIVYPQTTINGNLTYTATKNATIDNNAVIKGQINHLEAATTDNRPNIFGKIISLFSMIALGMVAIIIDKKNTLRAVNELLNSPAKSILYGIAYFILIPVVSLILIFTIIGAPIALILMALYFIILYVAQIFAGIAIGNLFFEKTKIKTNEIWIMAFGMIILVTAVSLPIIGFSFRMIFIFLGMGAIINTKRNILKEIN